MPVPTIALPTASQIVAIFTELFLLDDCPLVRTEPPADPAAPPEPRPHPAAPAEPPTTR